MAINSRKISSFPVLDKLTGDEYLMVAYNRKSYKIPTSLLIGNAIKSITQTINTEDGGKNTVTFVTGEGAKTSFNIYNGKKGSTGDKGETGDKGPRGDSGIIIYNADVQDLIINDLSTDEYTEKELTEMILSAAQGITLNNALQELKEVYLDTQSEYDSLSAKNQIDNDTKYLIFEE